MGVPEANMRSPTVATERLQAAIFKWAFLKPTCAGAVALSEHNSAASLRPAVGEVSQAIFEKR